MSTMSQLKAWMRLATPEEQAALAKAAGTSRTYLYHLANDKSSYGRYASPGLARRLEEAAAPLAAANPRLPRLLRTDLAEACRACDFARQCLGASAITESEFRVEIGGEEK
jgi:hypothetical protein